MNNPELCQKVDLVPDGAKQRSWVLNDSANSNFNGVVRLGESPLYLNLSWRWNAKNPVNFVGIFRLDLPGLLAKGYVRPEPKDGYGPEIRLRIVRSKDGHFFIQVNQDGPALKME
ncbi:MAG: hypothetical protein ACYDH1_17780 [Anaerolineaceae bacterium]